MEPAEAVPMLRALDQTGKSLIGGIRKRRQHQRFGLRKSNRQHAQRLILIASRIDDSGMKGRGFSG
ncbi:MAG: hypothetical protein DMG70_11105 [Acidobacteria bacterium]|nr:MAG: hypothetical protein DMG70_11105 [Acidobacteriota bacterium]PYY05654.1 MAG: hypothetical protein DMG69_26115 [Acidobacteriota bacterium]